MTVSPTSCPSVSLTVFRRVVDGFQIVKIDEEHSGEAACSALEGAHCFHDVRAVRQTCECVMGRLVSEALGYHPLRGDVAERDQNRRAVPVLGVEQPAGH